MHLQKTTLSSNNEQIVCECSIMPTNAIILHGAGKAARTRYYSLAKELLDNEIGVVLFDFPGHGDSSGTLSESSLQRRFVQAQDVIAELCPENSELILIGFSMSGQTVCDLLPTFGKRIQAILLGCPAIYTPEVHNIEFGSEEFTSSIRQDSSWSNSTALQNLSTFQGRIVIAIGSDDEVIPTAVISSLRSAAKNCAYFEYPGASHQLANWLADHPAEQRRLVKELCNVGQI